MTVRSTQPLQIQRLRSLPHTLTLLLLLFRCSAGLPRTHPLRSAVDRVNGERGPFVALVMAYPAEAAAVRSSGAFVPSSLVPSVDLYGTFVRDDRSPPFILDTLKSLRRRAEPDGLVRPNRLGLKLSFFLFAMFQLNAGITVQILLDVFDVRGIVHYGTAGSANDSLSYGDVSVPKFVAYTGSWKWTKFGSTNEPSRDLMFGEYNEPTEGANLLSAVKFKTEELYSVGKPMEEVFWLEVNAAWFRVAEQCLPEAPKVVFGLKASTADVFVDNAAYREFLFKKFGVSTVDEESAAVIMVNQTP